MKQAWMSIVFVVCSSFVSMVSAESTQQALAEEYLALSKTKETIDLTIESYVNRLHANNPRASKRQLRSFFNAYMGWDVLKEPATDIVVSNLTRAELSAVNGFYKTPHGKSIADKSPAVAAELSDLIIANLNRTMANME